MSLLRTDNEKIYNDHLKYSNAYIRNVEASNWYKVALQTIKEIGRSSLIWFYPKKKNVFSMKMLFLSGFFIQVKV